MSKKKVRAVFVISNLEYGGAQRQIAELFNHLDDEHFDMHICSLSDYIPLATDLKHHNGHLHIIKKHYKFDFSVVFRLARLLRKLKANVVVSYLFDADIAARLAGRMVGIKVINSERNSNYYLKRIQLTAYHFTKKMVDLWIGNSHAGVNFNRNVLQHSEAQYRVIHNGVDTDKFRPQDIREAKVKLGIDPEIKLMGMFASFKDQKNHPMLLRAMKKVLSTIPDLKLLYVGEALYKGMHGSSEYATQIRSLIDELDLQNHCIFMGNQDDVSSLYPACDITVLPSKYEGTPNVILESMACGVPVVATDVSDNAIIIKHEHVGFLVELDDVDALTKRIVDLLVNDDLRQEFGQNARQWVKERFSSAVLARKTHNALEQLLTDANTT